MQFYEFGDALRPLGEKAPEICPVCAHPQAYFEVRVENY